jgi:hypothetical protein
MSRALFATVASSSALLLVALVSSCSSSSSPRAPAVLGVIGDDAGNTGTTDAALADGSAADEDAGLDGGGSGDDAPSQTNDSAADDDAGDAQADLRGMHCAVSGWGVFPVCNADGGTGGETVDAGVVLQVFLGCTLPDGGVEQVASGEPGGGSCALPSICPAGDTFNVCAIEGTANNTEAAYPGTLVP